jgi:hypothetical protein
MPTCNDVITRAFRKARVYGTGETPTPEDMADALDELQNLYEQWGTSGMFGRLKDTIQADGYEAEPFERVQIPSGTVTLPTDLDDDPETPPNVLSFVEVVNTGSSTVTRYIYENGAWVEIGGLALADEAPLSGRGMAGLAACLAMEMGEWGGEATPTVARQAAAFKAGLALNLGSEGYHGGGEYY